MAPRRKVFRIIFTNQGKVYEVYARKVVQGDLHGFVEVEGILFGERTTILVDPGEEQLKLEFAGVQRMHIPYHAVQRIDEVEKEGAGKVVPIATHGERSEGGNATVMPFPGPERR
jgi:hypothetical protein